MCVCVFDVRVCSSLQAHVGVCLEAIIKCSHCNQSFLRKQVHIHHTHYTSHTSHVHYTHYTSHTLHITHVHCLNVIINYYCSESVVISHPGGVLCGAVC